MNFRPKVCANNRLSSLVALELSEAFLPSQIENYRNFGGDFQDFQVFQLNHGPKLSAFQDSAWPILFLGQKSNSRLRVVSLNLPEPNLQPEIFKISKL